MSAEENHYKGKTFEEQVARFLEKRGWTPTLGRHFKGRVAVRKHDCDIFAKKRSGGWTFVAIVCFLLVIARGSYWLGLFSTRLPEELQELVPTFQALPRWLQAVIRSLNWLTPLGFLLGLIAAKHRTKYLWVECKNLQESIKRDLIMKLQYQFRDVRKFGTWECWLVSTSRFDEDAIVHARAHKVTCYRVVEPGRRNMALHRVESKTGDV